MNEKLRKDLHELEVLTESVTAEASETIEAQLNELASKKVSELPELKKALLEEADYLDDCAKYHYDMYKKTTQTADEIKTQVKEFSKYEKHSGKKVSLFAKPNARIDYEEKISLHFARGNTFYKYFWVFFIGCFAGVIIETIYCFLQNGNFQSRVGLIWGPFNLVYGFGAVVFHFLLYRYRNRSWGYSFIGGFIAGSVVEYVCSFVQEMLFGSTSWDYSGYPLNINGRVCLLYSIFWGILGVAWIKWLYPHVAQWILKIPNSFGKKLTIILTVFMVINSIWTVLVVGRWQSRFIDKQPASNKIEEFIDERYPNERMKITFPNFQFKKQDAQ